MKRLQQRVRARKRRQIIEFYRDVDHVPGNFNRGAFGSTSDETLELLNGALDYIQQ